MIKILIVDDSVTEAKLLKLLFESEPGFKVVGCAENGKEAILLTQNLKPDIITMDIHMPEMNGFEATTAIMSQYPTPIIVISSRLNDETLNASFLALEAGAVSVLDKPKNFTSPQYAKEREKIIDTIKAMAGIKVIKKRFYTDKGKKTIPVITQLHRGNFEILAIGASVGGPQALKMILKSLSSDFSIPIVIVQHMTPGFISGFAKWLNNHTELKVKYAEHHELLKKGNVYFAPDHYHMEIDRTNEGLITKLVKGPPISGFCPSITVLFNSIAKICGKNAIGALLTGMGNDGAQGLLALKNARGHTIIQDRESAVVFGMAGVAQNLNAVDKIVKLGSIAEYLNKLTKPK